MAINKAPKFRKNEDRIGYLKNHIGNDLKWLFRAATEWYLQEQLQLPIEGYHPLVYSMDSTFLHARALFEFLTEDNTKKEDRFYYSVIDFGLIEPITSDLYKKSWRGPVHSHAGIHMQDRNKNKQLETRTGSYKDLNKMPLDFALEICRLWERFIEKLEDTDLRGTAEILLRVALTEADKVRRSIVENQRNKYPDCKKAFNKQIIPQDEIY